MSELEKVLADFGHAVRQGIERYVVALTQIGRALHDAMWAEYEKAGKPYGDSDEGMWQWAKRIAEAQRLEDQAAYIRSNLDAFAKLQERMGAR